MTLILARIQTLIAGLATKVSYLFWETYRVFALWLLERLTHFEIPTQAPILNLTAQEAGRWRVWFPVVSLGFFVALILPAAVWPWDRLRDSNKNEYQGYILRGKGCRCARLTVLPPSCVDCLEILAASASCSAKGLSRPVMGLLYF
jgi:hypothetical protein